MLSTIFQAKTGPVATSPLLTIASELLAGSGARRRMIIAVVIIIVMLVYRGSLLGLARATRARMAP